MVDDRVTDSTRIAQLLASELTGLDTRPLADVSLVAVESDATPSEDGTEAYRVAYRGTAVASVSLSPGTVELRLLDDRTWPDMDRACRASGRDDARGGPGEAHTGRDDIVVDGDSLHVTSGAAVKRAVDAFGDALESTDAR